jgi:actin-like ATPase involved in cell morphogenesis
MRTQGYVLGVDLGTTFTAAAVARPGEPAVGVPLGSRAAATPTVAYLGADGEFLVGEHAARRALTDPERVVREFKRRIGDETPLLLGTGGDRIPAHRLAALVTAWVVNTVSARQGERPETVVVTHPAAWGAHKQQLLRGALIEVGVPDPMLITEPYAAAVAYADSRELEPQSTLAVYDLGGGTFDASVLRVEASGEFTELGRPIGLPDLGGIDFDDAILAHIVETLGEQVASLDPTDPVVAAALTRLRQECVDAKEALSADTVVTIPVVLGTAATNLRLTRTEFEVMIEPAVARTVEALDVALAEAEVPHDGLRHLLLTGGSARVPFIRQALSAHFGAAVAIGRDLDPKLAVAIGAAMTGARRGTAVPLVPAPATPDTETTLDRPALTALPARPVAEFPDLVASEKAARIPASRMKRTAGALGVAGVAAALALGVIPGPSLPGGRDESQPARSSGHLQEERVTADQAAGARGASVEAGQASTTPTAAGQASGQSNAAPALAQQPAAPTTYRARTVAPTRVAPQVAVVRRDAPAVRRAAGTAAKPSTAQTPRTPRTEQRPATPRVAAAPERTETTETPQQPAAATEQSAPATAAQPSAPQSESTSSGGTSWESGPATPAAPPQAPPRTRGFAPTAPPSPGG